RSPSTWAPDSPCGCRDGSGSVGTSASSRVVEAEMEAREKSYDVIRGAEGVPIKAWTRGVMLDENARKQLLNVARMPFVHGWVAVMPDVHWGIGATVGSVIPTTGAIIPAAVGVDIGCGMSAVGTTLTARD